MNNKWNNISKLLKMSCIIGLPIILQSFATHRNNIRKVKRIQLYNILQMMQLRAYYLQQKMQKNTLLRS